MRFCVICLPLITLFAVACGDDTVTQPVTGPSVPFFDDFEDGRIDPNQWNRDEPEHTLVEEKNGRLEISILGSASGSSFGANIHTLCTLIGDYDIQVDYEILDWPAKNGVRVGLAVAGTATERVSFAQGEFNSNESYAADHWGSVTAAVTDHMSGTLRAVRVGDVATSFYKDGSDWTPIRETVHSLTEGYRPHLMVWSHDGLFIGQDVRVAFDNFKISLGTLESCD